MPSPATRPQRNRRSFRLAWLGLVLLLFGWLSFTWGRPAWWGFIDCPAICAPKDEASSLRLRSGVALTILSNELSGDRLRVTYLTQGDLRERSRFCEEVRDVVWALQARGALAGANELLLEPTDPHTRLFGVTWSGPVFGCCVSTAIFGEETGHGQWELSSGGCRNE